MRVLDLFSGIGGFSLGLERAGMETVAFCEIDPYCRRVLAKHWPHVPIHNDIRELDGGQYAGAVDVICGGFPCQDASVANNAGRGIEGERTGLFFEIARISGELRPKYILLENVSALLARGFGAVLGSLAELGYSCVWDCIPGSAIGAPHKRERLWVIAYPSSGCRNDIERAGELKKKMGALIADANNSGCEKQWLSQPDGAEYATFERDSGWSPLPKVCGVDDGVPNRVDRIRSLGNAVIPQIPEILGRAVMEVA